MKTINVGEKTSNTISESISEMVAMYAKKQQVQAVYMHCYDQKTNPNSLFIKLVCVVEGVFDDQDEREFRAIRKTIKEDDQPELQLYTDYALDRHYDTIMMDSVQSRACNDLVNGTILFDRNGEYTDKQKRLEERLKLGRDCSDLLLYTNTIDFEPPLQLPEVSKQRIKKFNK